MPSRNTPRGDDERYQALRAAADRAGSVDPEDLAFSAATKARLDAMMPLFNSAMLQRRMALAMQVTSTELLREKGESLRLLVSHFFQNLNFGIERGVFAAPVRALYQLHMSQTTLPPMATQADLITSSGWAVSGEAARVAAGGLPIPFPTATEIATARDEFLALSADASSKKDALDTAQERAAELRDDADALIRDIWDEVEFTFRRDTYSSLRRKARQYGVVYITRPGEAPEEPAEGESPATSNSSPTAASPAAEGTMPGESADS